ncbi:hypothetical protein [uncultured Roseobacter sp.]|uniref:hypothetical protein n=1 Tax=uncultured Roseobacter sp. TaxID=114847 RepID=UPI00262CACCE|nr:hypothetical protein [uncultured Roseobacter sp.]
MGRETSSGQPTDYISLAYAMHCMLSGENFDSDAAKPTIKHQFPAQDPAFERLLRDLMDEKLCAFGILSVVDVDLPALEGHIVSDDVRLACLNWRQKGEIILASGNEAEPTKVPPAAWWNDGVIWEQSILRVNDPDQFEDRVGSLDVERHVPQWPNRPYDFERAICFTEIKFRLAEIIAWSNLTHTRTEKAKKANSRGAGMKQTEDYPAIEARLWELIDQGKEWANWSMVWADVRDLFRDPEAQEESEQPSKKLTEHLKANATRLHSALRARIETVKRRRG